MTVYVLIHGGYVGGWVWRDVVRFLRAAGHEVYRPTLTGLGERAHLAHPGIDLDTHIQDVVGVLEWESLQDVVLVGHSSSTMVITGVAEVIPERIGHLVYLDTAIPQDGQSWLDLLGPELTEFFLELVRTQGDGWRIPFFADDPRSQAHPIKTVTQPLKVKNPAAAAIPRTFIHCTNKEQRGRLAPIWPAINRAAAWAQEQGWRYRTLPTGHNAMQTMPRELADLLLELA